MKAIFIKQCEGLLDWTYCHINSEEKKTGKIGHGCNLCEIWTIELVFVVVVAVVVVATIAVGFTMVVVRTAYDGLLTLFLTLSLPVRLPLCSEHHPNP